MSIGMLGLGILGFSYQFPPIFLSYEGIGILPDIRLWLSGQQLAGSYREAVRIGVNAMSNKSSQSPRRALA
jgi:hypothetical protein